jgi:hypothetical protein
MSMSSNAGTYEGGRLELRLDDDGRVAQIGFADPGDEERVRGLLSGTRSTPVQVAPLSDADTVGHAMGAEWRLRLVGLEGDDTEGHAISIHFPTRAEAEAFKKRTLATGVLVGTLVIGGVGVAGLQGSASVGTAVGGGAPAAVEQSVGEIGGGPAAATSEDRSAAGASSVDFRQRGSASGATSEDRSAAGASSVDFRQRGSASGATSEDRSAAGASSVDFRQRGASGAMPADSAAGASSVDFRAGRASTDASAQDAAESSEEPGMGGTRGRIPE